MHPRRARGSETPGAESARGGLSRSQEPRPERQQRASGRHGSLRRGSCGRLRKPAALAAASASCGSQASRRAARRRAAKPRAPKSGKAVSHGAFGRPGQRGGRQRRAAAARQCSWRPPGCPRPVAACHPLYFKSPQPPKGGCAARGAPGGTRPLAAATAARFPLGCGGAAFSPPLAAQRPHTSPRQLAPCAANLPPQGARSGSSRLRPLHALLLPRPPTLPEPAGCSRKRLAQRPQCVGVMHPRQARGSEAPGAESTRSGLSSSPAPRPARRQRASGRYGSLRRGSCCRLPIASRSGSVPSAQRRPAAAARS